MSHTSSTPAVRVFGSAAPPPPVPSLRPIHDARHPQPYPPPPPAPISFNASQPSSALPMAIPNAREAPPPPLPPPRYIHELHNGQDPGWQWANNRSEAAGDIRSAPITPVRPGSSLLGGAENEAHSIPDDRLGGFDSGQPLGRSNFSTQDVEMRGMEQKGHADERRTRPSLANFRLQSESQLGQRAVHNSAQAYDKQVLSKIGGPAAGGSRRSSSHHPTSSAHDSHQRRGFNKFAGQLKPLSVPEHRHGSLDSPLSRWQSAPSAGMVSPTSGFRSPLAEMSIDSAISPRHGSHGQLQTPTSTSTSGVTCHDMHEEYPRPHRNSDDHGVFMDPEFGVEENRLRELNINDHSPSLVAAGDDNANPQHSWGFKGPLKRRASSPPSETRDDRISTTTTASSSSHASNANPTHDFYSRRTSQLPTSAHPRLNPPNFPSSSLSSVSSSLGGASSGWSFSLASSATTASYGSPADRLSPGALSPSSEREHGVGPGSPFGMQRNAAAPARSPRGGLGKTGGHLRKGSDEHGAAGYWGDGRRTSRHHDCAGGGSRGAGYFVCECCPKKPKKFNTRDELRGHEMEKQYQCQYCPNRFKNKNEAERHQNSLHLRRHSWSCAALTTPQSVFHPSTSPVTTPVDPNNATSPSTPPSSNITSPTIATADVCGYCGMEFPNPPDWAARTEHLSQVHKFGECNQAKKFFRADHFRQHLKHSHAGLSGKWTNVLENACMRDEPVPQPLHQQPPLAPQPLPGQQQQQTIVVGAPPPVPPLGLTAVTGLM